ncbi:MAG: glycoside hydrolase family 172 protein [Anaerolineae bacterium]
MASHQWFDFLRVDNTRHTQRASSWDITGGNRDRLSIGRGETHTLLDVQGAGCITHIWFTAQSIESFWLRKLVLKMYWDGEDEPSVLAPVGDFFGAGHAEAVQYTSLPMVMAPRDGHGLNCYLPMPFSRGARIEVTSENYASEIRLYYNIDWERWEAPQEDLGRFHACWRRENPTDGIAEPPEMDDHTFQHAGANLSDAGNYLLLEAQGQGQYVGCNLNIHALRTSKAPQFNWYGEGDEMIFVDEDNEGERWPPTLHGTGTEDYFNTAWGPDQAYSSPFFGLTRPGGPNYSGHISWYRWHLLDPVRFSRSVRVSIEHGHANRRSDDFSSTAYWYQIEPHKTFGILPVAQRMPRADWPEEKG